MVDSKMCVGIIKDELMCRIDPELHDEATARKGARTMDFTNRPMRGYVMVHQSGLRTSDDLRDWVQLCLDFNAFAKSSKKKSG